MTLMFAPKPAKTAEKTAALLCSRAPKSICHSRRDRSQSGMRTTELREIRLRNAADADQLRATKQTGVVEKMEEYGNVRPASCFLVVFFWPVLMMDR
jgi:hypothetical protein